MYDAFRNETALPDVGTLVRTSAPVHPLLSRRNSSVFKTARFMCNPPTIAIHSNIAFWDCNPLHYTVDLMTLVIKGHVRVSP